MARPIPQELIDHIIDRLSDDHKALVACRLAGRSMVDRTRLHIFYSVTLASVKRYVAFEKLIKSTPAIARCVRKLVVTKMRRNITQVDRELPRILEKLPNAVYLSVEQWNPEDMSRDMWAKLPTYLARIQVLHIGYKVRFSKVLFLEFLNACPGLRRLWLDMAGWSFKEWSGPQNTLPGNIKALETLTLGRYHHQIASNLRFDRPPRRLEVVMDPPDACRNLQTFLTGCGDGVQHLSLVVDSIVVGDMQWAEWHASQTLELAPNLVSFKLQTFPPLSEPFIHLYPLAGYPHSNVLCMITKRHARLRRLGFAINLQHLERLDSPYTEKDSPEFWAHWDADLVRIAGDHPDLEVEFEIVCIQGHRPMHDRPLHDYQRRAIAVIKRGLSAFLATETKVRVIVGSMWGEDSVFEGGLFGDVLEWSCPS